MIYVAYLVGLGAWICSILIGIKGIQKKDTVLGIICILCTIVGVIMGWVKQKEWGIDKNLTLACTGLFVAYLVLAGIAMSTMTVTTP